MTSKYTSSFNIYPRSRNKLLSNRRIYSQTSPNNYLKNVHSNDLETRSQPISTRDSNLSFLYQKERPGNETTITQIVTTDDKSEYEVNLTTSINEFGVVYALFLPFIVDSRFKKIKQPIIFKVDEVQFIEFGFNVPFSDFMDLPNNVFEIKFGRHYFSGHIIAVGKSPLELKKCMESNIQRNSNWKNCVKMIGDPNRLVELKHIPVSDISNLPNDKMMNVKEYLDLLDFIKDSSNQDQKTTTKRKGRNEKVTTESPSKYQRNRMQNNTDQNTKVDEDLNNLTEDDGEPEIITKTMNPIQDEKILASRILQNLEQLNERQKLVNRFDLNGSILLDLISIVKDMNSLWIAKTYDDSILSRKISTTDCTFKVKKKDLVFIEGKIQLVYSSYRDALQKSKPKNPFSFAYQLINCFPEQYTKNVSLGKKYYEDEEMTEMLKQIRKPEPKFSLCFIWSFKDPFDKPLTGDFDRIRGIERVNALLDHILRKSGIMEVDQFTEQKVRDRIGKELCSKNAKLRKKSEKNNDIRTNKQDDESTSEKIWDIRCFSK